MRNRAESLLRDSRVHLVGDVLLALALAGSSVVGIATGDASWGSPAAPAVALALLSTLPVAARSHAPVTAALVVFAADGLCMIAAAPHQAAFQPFVALVFVSYALGSAASAQHRVVAPVLLLVLSIGLGSVAMAAGTHGGDVIPSLVWLAAAYGLGRLVRSWRARATELELLYRELAEQRELQAEAAVAVERSRIARELHDVIAHNISMMVVQAGAAARVVDGEQPHVRTALGAIEASGRETIDEMRRLLGVFRSADDGLALTPQPGLKDLEALIASVRDAGVPVELCVDGLTGPLPSGIDVSAYRIVQEALTNTLKHAGTASAAVSVRCTPSALELEVRDDGDGSGTGGGTGNGLIGMRERVALWGGGLDAGRQPDGGWVVRARLPLDGAAT
jgi:signal transduction histidine kinase